MTLVYFCATYGEHRAVFSFGNKKIKERSLSQMIKPQIKKVTQRGIYLMCCPWKKACSYH